MAALQPAHPDEPGVYLAGIECDGAMYHSSAYARERDKIRQTVLEGLGWTLFRVWSTDWWINRQGALQTLDDHLHAHLEAERARRLAPVQDTAPDELLSLSADTDKIDANTAGNNSGRETFEDASNAELFPTEKEPERTRPIVARKAEESSGPQLDDRPKKLDEVNYLIASLDLDDFPPDPAKFYDQAYDRRLIRMIDHVIDEEGPIHEDVLVRRIARHHGFKRAGSRIRDRIINLAVKRRGQTREDVGRFYWRKGTVKERVAPARWQGRDEETRRIDRISVSEIQSISKAINERDPKEIARAIGVGHLSATAKARIEKSLDDLD